MRNGWNFEQIRTRRIERRYSLHTDDAPKALSSQGPQKCDQRLAIARGKTEPERMALHGISPRRVGPESGGLIIIARAAWVEPVFERGAPATVAEHASIPDALERRHLVVAGPAACLRGESGIGPHGEWQNIVARVGGAGKPGGERQLVVRVQRRGMAARAALAREDFLAPACERVGGVRIGRRLQLVQIQRERIQLLIAVPPADIHWVRRVGEMIEARAS